MAHIEYDGFDEVLKKLDKLSKKSEVDEIAKKAVDQAKDIVANSMRSALSSSEYGPRSTGSIAASVKPTESKINSYGAYSVARPTGRDARGMRNGEKAAYLEYGTPHMAARPWRGRATSSAEGPAKTAMENVLRAEMELE